MTVCTHRVCRFAKSDELLLQSVKAAREGDLRGSDALLKEVRAAHFDYVTCRQMDEPKPVAPRQEALGLTTKDPSEQGVRP